VVTDTDPAGEREALRRLAEAAGAIEGAVAEVIGRGEAAGGLVRAVTDSAGRAVEVVVAPPAMRLGSGKLADGVTRALQASYDDAQDQVRRVLEEAAGEVPSRLLMDPGEAKRRYAEFEDEFRDVMAGYRKTVDQLNRDRIDR
jgi:DNA-binding protein YbaB